MKCICVYGRDHLEVRWAGLCHIKDTDGPEKEAKEHFVSYIERYTRAGAIRQHILDTHKVHHFYVDARVAAKLQAADYVNDETAIRACRIFKIAEDREFNEEEVERFNRKYKDGIEPELEIESNEMKNSSGAENALTKVTTREDGGFCRTALQLEKRKVASVDVLMPDGELLCRINAMALDEDASSIGAVDITWNKFGEDQRKRGKVIMRRDGELIVQVDLKDVSMVAVDIRNEKS